MIYWWSGKYIFRFKYWRQKILGKLLELLLKNLFCLSFFSPHWLLISRVGENLTEIINSHDNHVLNVRQKACGLCPTFAKLFAGILLRHRKLIGDTFSISTFISHLPCMPIVRSRAPLPMMWIIDWLRSLINIDFIYC